MFQRVEKELVNLVLHATCHMGSNENYHDHI